MKKTELVYNHVSLWHRHHAECIEVAIKAKEQGSDVVFLSCKGMLLGCPANPRKSEALCNKCVKQTTRTEKILNKYGIETCALDDTHYPKGVVAPSSRDELVKFEYNEAVIGNLVYNNAATILGDGFFDATDDLVYSLLLNAISLYDFAIHLIKCKKIDKVSVWNGRRSSDGPVLLAAEKLGIKFSAFISGSKNMSITMFNAKLVHDLSRNRNKIKEIFDECESKKCWEVAAHEASNYFEMARGLKDKSFTPYGFKVYSESFEHRTGVFEKDSKRKKIAIFVGTFLEITGLDGYEENIKVEYGNFYDAIKRICSDEKVLSNCQIVVRWHPNSKQLNGNERMKLNSVIEATSSDVMHLRPENNYDSYELLSDAELVVSVGSSMAVESAYYKKPVIFIGNNVFDQFSFPVVVTHQQFVRNVLNGPVYDMNLAYKEALAYGCYRLLDYSFYMEKISYLYQNRYRSRYMLGSDCLIDVKPKLYSIKLLLLRLRLTSHVKKYLGYVEKKRDRVRS